VTYSHSFSPEFYYGEDDDNTESPYPTTVRQALLRFQRVAPHEWAEMLRLYLYPAAEVVDVEQLIRETNTVDSFESPVEVWIDQSGFYRVNVYDEKHAARLLAQHEPQRPVRHRFGCFKVVSWTVRSLLVLVALGLAMGCSTSAHVDDCLAVVEPLCERYLDCTGDTTTYDRCMENTERYCGITDDVMAPDQQEACEAAWDEQLYCGESGSPAFSTTQAACVAFYIRDGVLADACEQNPHAEECW
jgi:hypothetical protein